MKWENKTVIKKIERYDKDERDIEKGYRIVTKFLFFPKTLGTETKWFCRASIKQRRKQTSNFGSRPLIFYDKWADDEWLENTNLWKVKL